MDEHFTRFFLFSESHSLTWSLDIILLFLLVNTRKKKTLNRRKDEKEKKRGRKRLSWRMFCLNNDSLVQGQHSNWYSEKLQMSECKQFAVDSGAIIHEINAFLYLSYCSCTGKSFWRPATMLNVLTEMFWLFILV